VFIERDEDHGLMRNDSAPLDVGRRLRAVREVRYQNRDDAAADYRQRFGSMSLGTFAKWENRGELSVPDLLRVAQLLHCDPCWLLTGAGDAFTTPSESEVAELRARLDRVEAERREDDSPPEAEAG
jgi:hypothetical protein